MPTHHHPPVESPNPKIPATTSALNKAAKFDPNSEMALSVLCASTNPVTISESDGDTAAQGEVCMGARVSHMNVASSVPTPLSSGEHGLTARLTRIGKSKCAIPVTILKQPGTCGRLLKDHHFHPVPQVSLRVFSSFALHCTRKHSTVNPQDFLNRYYLCPIITVIIINQHR
jgi:hypothetical protein